MITAIIVDDEPKNVSMLITLLQQYCPQVKLLGTANSALAGKKLVDDLSPQLIFLDIEMPYGNGFDMLQMLPGLQAEVVFITAFDQYAVNAFRYAALDYLLKPVNIDQLTDAVYRAEKRVAEKHTANNYELLLRNLDEKDVSRQTIMFSDKGEQHLVQLQDIIYIIADGSYCHIYTTSRTIVAAKNLKDFEGMLPASLFCRIHHGHIINKNLITKIKKGRGGSVIMKDGKELEIAVRKKDDFLKMLHK